MMRRLRRRLARSRDEGAILVFALIIVTTIALVVGTVLTRGDGSLRATVQLRSVAGSSYAADAAANVAINDLRTGYGFAGNPSEKGFNNSLDGIGCFGNSVGVGGTDTLPMNQFYPATGTSGKTSALVECTGEEGTGQRGSPVPINNSNKPGYAIITLDGPLTTADVLKVHGGVYSNSTINGQVSLDAGDAWAFGTCSQTTVVAPATKHCSSGQKIADPGASGQPTAAAYAPDLGSTVPDLQKPPTTCTSGVAVFTPGYYDDAAALNTATGLCSVAWFKPGTYYFDFHNDGCANVCPTNLFGSGTTSSSNRWVINGATVVAGTPTDPATGAILARPPTNPAMPGSCQSPITDTSAVGVQFVFGGNSQIYIDQNSHVELCGSYHANRPPIELYGLKSGSTPSSATATGLKPTGAVTATGDGTWTGLTSANIDTVGGGSATWAPGSANARTSTVTANGFTPGSAIPAGAVLTSATLRVTHQDSEATSTSAGTATIKVGSTTTAALPIGTVGSATMTTTNVTLNSTTNSGAFNSLQTAVHDGGYTGATVAYTAKSKKNASALLDAITLDLTYYVPVLRGQGGTCVQGTSGSCKFLSMKNGNNKILLYLQGTTYVPYADVDVQLGNFSAEVAKFGIVARQLEFAITNGNPSWTGPIFEIPDNSPGYGYENTTVHLKVHVCLGRPTCSTSDPVALTARVQVWDPSGAPDPPKRQISVLSWSHTR